MNRVVLVLGILAFVAPAVAGAEIYKCKGPDGTMLFTADASQCPGARAHELKGRVQSVDARPATPSTATPPPSARAATAANQAAEARRWALKKRTAQHELNEARARLSYVEETVKSCNRGSILWVEDDAGLRKKYSCDKVKREYAQMQATVAKLEDYVAHGLEDECRRAGCLPGWLR